MMDNFLMINFMEKESDIIEEKIKFLNNLMLMVNCKRNV